MPKDDRKDHYERRSRASPYYCSSSDRHSSSRYLDSLLDQATIAKGREEWEKKIKVWDEVRCPICMEQPHNAVLLVCSSHDKGCRPFMCDTSYRHSNCLDQYRKSSAESTCGECQQKASLACPLCRGPVSHWMVVEAARDYMNSKVRTCSLDSCDFAGVYKDLRKHARKEHPLVRPSEADPARQLDWCRMERQRDIGDLVSAVQLSLNNNDANGASDDEEEEYNGRVYSGFPLMIVLLMTAGRAEPEEAGSTDRVSRNGGRRRALVVYRTSSRPSYGREAGVSPPNTTGEGANLGFTEEDNSVDVQERNNDSSS